MSLVKLMTVEVLVLIKGRGLLVAPGPLEEDWRGTGGELDGEWRSPDGQRGDLTVLISMMFQNPPPLELRLGVILKGVDEDDIPIGTEIWCDLGSAMARRQSSES